MSLTDQELAELERLHDTATPMRWANAAAAALGVLPALIAEIRRLRDHFAGAGKAIARNDVLEEAARVADSFADMNAGSPAADLRMCEKTAADVAAAIRALKDASLPDYSGGGS